MKAQRVKNAVIVPAGAKGGFVVKQPPRDPAPAARGGRGVLPPVHRRPARRHRQPRRRQGRAARRRSCATTATIPISSSRPTRAPPPSPTSRTRSRSRAASGSATRSRRAASTATTTRRWASPPAVRGNRCAATSGISTSIPIATTSPLSGIGDMSGDVFGNGMLLSQHIKLVAAFDHRHVFLDPDPDAGNLVRRTAATVRAAAFVVGRLRHRAHLGGRRRVPAHVEVDHDHTRSAYRDSGIDDARRRACTPTELIRAILRAPVDLLYNGGIGTYVKATTETNAASATRRTTGCASTVAELRCRAVGEGGNLGLHPGGPGRVRADTAVASTPTRSTTARASTPRDHEVNIKILLDGAVRDGEMPSDRSQRAARFDDRRSRGARAARQLPPEPCARQRRRAVDRDGRGARAVHARARARQGISTARSNGCPTDEQLADRHNAGLGLAVPELAVLLGYAKITLEEELLGVAAARRPRSSAGARPLVPVGAARSLPRSHSHAHAAPRDHRDRGRERRRESGRTHVRRSVSGRDRRVEPRHRARPRSGTRDLRPGRALARHRSARQSVGRRRPNRRCTSRAAGSCERGDPLAVAPPRAEPPDRGDRRVLRGARGAPRGDGHHVAALPRRCRDVRRAGSAAPSSRYAWPPSTGSPRRSTSSNSPTRITPRSRTCLPPTTQWANSFDSIGSSTASSNFRARDGGTRSARNALREDAAAQHRVVTDAVIRAGSYDAWATQHSAVVGRVLTLLDDLRTHGVYDVATLSVALRELRSLS